MSDGTRRADVPYVWSPKIRQPPRPPKLVYLDLNHWIALSKCMASHKDGTRYTEVLEACLTACRNGRAAFPISDAIYIEITNIRQHDQRKRLREVIEEVSGYLVVMSRVVVATLEIEAMLDSLVGPNSMPINEVRYLDWGVARAFGIVGRFRVFDDADTDITEEAAEAHPLGYDSFMRMLSEAELELNRGVLDGPSTVEQEEMISFGWGSRPTLEYAKHRAQDEIDQVKRLDTDSRWRRGKIRDIVSAREVMIEINSILFEGMHGRGISSLESVFATPHITRTAFDSMPSFDVSVSLKTSYHRDAEHRWTYNDIYDISAMASTIPYCDIIVTDKAVASHIKRSGLSERLNTTVLSNLADLPALL